MHMDAVNWCIRGLLVATVLVVAPAGWSATEPVVQALEKDQQALEEALVNQDIASAWLLAASGLHRWLNYPDFPSFSKKLEEGYSWLPKDALRNEFERRRSLLTGSINGIGGLELGYLGMVLEDYAGAAACFQQALKDPEIQSSPFPRAYLGRALLFGGSLNAATSEYEAAVQQASVDKATLFRVRHLFLSDLLDAGRMSAMLKYAPACLSSDYPLERAWALENWIYYLWSQGDSEELGRRIVELRNLVPTLTVRPDLPFEQDRYERAQTLLSEVERAAQGDPVMLMAMDEEATTVDFANGEFEKALERLKPWVEKYPIREYASWKDDTTKKVGIWVNYVHAGALARLDRFGEAEAGFREIIQYVPITEFSGRIVDAYGWLGVTLKGQRRLEEARQVLETALSLDVSRVDERFLTALPHDFTQARVKSGETSATLRASIVKQYEEVQAALQNVDGGSK
jgi:tetratricopeptide (TPR) repeat protein